MFSLILMTCISLNCQHIEVVSQHLTMAACEQAMMKAYDDLEDGQAVMCIKVVGDEVET